MLEEKRLTLVNGEEKRNDTLWCSGYAVAPESKGYILPALANGRPESEDLSPLDDGRGKADHQEEHRRNAQKDRSCEVWIQASPPYAFQFGHKLGVSSMWAREIHLGVVVGATLLMEAGQQRFMGRLAEAAMERGSSTVATV